MEKLLIRIWLEKQQVRQLSDLAAERRRSRAVVIQDAIAAYLDTHHSHQTGMSR